MVIAAILLSLLLFFPACLAGISSDFGETPGERRFLQGVILLAAVALITSGLAIKSELTRNETWFESRRWANGEVEASRITSSGDSDDYVLVEYSFEAAGQTYKGSDSGLELEERSLRELLDEAYAVDTKVRVAYDPADPTSSNLDGEAPNNPISMSWLLGFGAVCQVLVLIWLGWRILAQRETSVRPPAKSPLPRPTHGFASVDRVTLAPHLICAYCRVKFSESLLPVLACRSCAAFLHEACASESSGCPTLGCAS